MASEIKKLNVQTLVEKLSASHPLQATGGNYKHDFIAAAELVYPAQKIEKILQEKFFIPDDSKFKLDTYLESAAELSVQNDLKRNSTIKNFKINKRVNPPKDVDAYYDVSITSVALEIKCPKEEAINPDAYVVHTAGRIPDHEKTLGDFKSTFEGPKTGNKLVIAKNKDNTMREFLTNANAKFSPKSGFDNLNILLVACGNLNSVQQWWHWLYGGEGLFTSQSFHPWIDYELVDVVVLSNLKYYHTEARQYHDWTLKNAFLLPCRNSHPRSSLVFESVKAGLSVFNHHLVPFSQYTPEPLKPDAPFGMLKVFHYYADQLDENEKLRYFPVQPPKKKRP